LNTQGIDANASHTAIERPSGHAALRTPFAGRPKGESDEEKNFSPQMQEKKMTNG